MNRDFAIVAFVIVSITALAMINQFGDFGQDLITGGAFYEYIDEEDLSNPLVWDENLVFMNDLYSSIHLYNISDGSTIKLSSPGAGNALITSAYGDLVVLHFNDGVQWYVGYLAFPTNGGRPFWGTPGKFKNMGGVNQFYPDIWDTSLVFEVHNVTGSSIAFANFSYDRPGCFSGSTPDPCLDISNVTIISSGINNSLPRVWGERVVWHNDTSILYFNGSSVQKVDDGSNADVHEDIIVYENGGRIFAYNISNSTKTEISNGSTDNYKPRIYENIVAWEGGNSSLEYSIIYSHDLAANVTNQLGCNGSNQLKPYVSDSYIAWQENNSLNGFNVFFVDIGDSVVCDADSDGYTIAQGDCNDENGSINPGAFEITCNGIDEDCDLNDECGSCATLNITTPGTHLLSSDLTNCSLAVQIKADDVLFDCNGSVLRGNLVDRKGTGTGIIIYGDNVTVQNCDISHFKEGINLYGSSSSKIINNNIHNNADYDCIEECIDPAINPSYYGCGHGKGIVTINAPNLIITNNSFIQNGAGIRLSSTSPNSLIFNNLIKQNTGYGINLNSNGHLENLNNASVVNNRFIENCGKALSIAGQLSSGHLVDNNTFNGQKGAAELAIEGSTNNIVTNNIFNGSLRFGMFLYNNVSNTTIAGNAFTNNMFGLLLFPLGDVVNNTIYNNCFSDNSVHATDGEKFDSNKWNSTILGNFWDDVIVNQDNRSIPSTNAAPWNLDGPRVGYVSDLSHDYAPIQHPDCSVNWSYPFPDDPGNVTINDTGGNITIEWGDVTNITHYNIKVDGLLPFTSPDIDVNVTSEYYDIDESELKSGNFYYVKVQACNGSFCSPGVVDSFTVYPNLNLTSVSETILNDSVGFTLNLSSYSSVIGTPGENRTYLVDFNSSLLNCVISVLTNSSNVLSCSPTGLLGIDVMNVTLFDMGNETSGYDNSSRFNVSSTFFVNVTSLPPIDPPGNLTPTDKNITSNGNITLNWTNVTGANYYDVQVDGLSNFTSPDIDENSTSPYLVINASDLKSGNKYYWRVQACNATDCSLWSNGSFNVLPVLDLSGVSLSPVLNDSSGFSIELMNYSSVIGTPGENRTYLIGSSLLDCTLVVLINSSNLLNCTPNGAVGSEFVNVTLFDMGNETSGYDNSSRFNVSSTFFVNVTDVVVPPTPPSGGGGGGGGGRCRERWSCSEWSDCDGITFRNTRGCIDLNNCDRAIPANSKPSESQICTLPNSCYNNQLDSGEGDVDCGGKCTPCPEPFVEVPEPVVEEPISVCSDRFSAWHLIALLIIIGLVKFISYSAYMKYLKKNDLPTPDWIVRMNKSVWPPIISIIILLASAIIMLLVDFACFESCLALKSKHLLLVLSVIISVLLGYIAYRRKKALPPLKFVLDEEWKKIIFFLLAFAVVLTLLLLHLHFTKTCIDQTSLGAVIKESPGFVGVPVWFYIILFAGLISLLGYSVYVYEKNHVSPAYVLTSPQIKSIAPVKATPVTSRLIKKSKALKPKPSVLHHQLEALPHPKPIKAAGPVGDGFDKLVEDVLNGMKLPGFDAVKAAERISKSFKALPHDVQSNKFVKFFSALEKIESTLK